MNEDLMNFVHPEWIKIEVSFEGIKSYFFIS